MYLIVKAYGLHSDQIHGLAGLSSKKYTVDAMGKIGGGNCATFVGYSLSELAATLEDYVRAETTGGFAATSRAHIMDGTALKGRFDFNLNYNKMYFLVRAPGVPLPASMIDNIPASDSISKVVRNQLGLRLERTASNL